LIPLSPPSPEHKGIKEEDKRIERGRERERERE
jgi:hypothetical protein